MRMFVLLAVIAGLANGQFPCNFNKECTPIGDARMDQTGGGVNSDFTREAAEFFGAVGRPSNSYLNSMISNGAAEFSQTPQKNCEIQEQGTYFPVLFSSMNVADPALKTERIMEMFLDGRFDLKRSISFPRTSTGVVMGGGPSRPFASQVTDCYNGASLDSVIPVDELWLVCSEYNTPLVITNGGSVNITAGFTCITARGRTIATSSVWVCPVFKFTRREVTRSIMKLRNLVASNDPLKGADSSLCDAAKGCHLVEPVYNENTLPLSRILMRQRMDDLLNSAKIQCSHRDWFNLESSSKALLERAQNKERREEDIKNMTTTASTWTAQATKKVPEATEKTTKGEETPPAVTKWNPLNLTRDEEIAIGVGVAVAGVTLICFFGTILFFMKRRNGEMGPS